MGLPGREWDRHLGGVPDGGVFPPTNDPWTVGPQGIPGILGIPRILGILGILGIPGIPPDLLTEILN